MRQNNFRGLNIICTNAHSLFNKLNDLKISVNSFDSKPDIIIITEVNAKNFTEMFTENVYILPGFNICSCNIGSKGKRGIIIYIDVKIKSSVLSPSNSFEECLCIEILDKHITVLTVVAIYRSPNSNNSNNHSLLNFISQVCKKLKVNYYL